MKKMSYAEAIREAMSIRMREDPNVLLFGEDVGAFGGCFGVSAGMFDEFGEKRVRDTPISEGAIIGAAVGSGGHRLRPIAELMFCDFLTVGMDQLVNQAAKMRYMFGRQDISADGGASAMRRGRGRSSAALPVAGSVDDPRPRPEGGLSLDTAGCAGSHALLHRRR